MREIFLPHVPFLPASSSSAPHHPRQKFCSICKNYIDQWSPRKVGFGGNWTCIQRLWARPHLLVGEESAPPGEAAPAPLGLGLVRLRNGGAGSRRDAPTGHVEVPSERASGRQGGRRNRSQPRARPSPEIGRRRPQAARAVYLVSEHTHYPAAESGCSRSRPPARDIMFQPRRWHRAQALAPASSPCLCSRLALGAQPSRRRRRAPGAGARCGPQGRRGRPRSPSDARPARSAALERPDLPMPTWALVWNPRRVGPGGAQVGEEGADRWCSPRGRSSHPGTTNARTWTLLAHSWGRHSPRPEAWGVVT